MSGWGRRLVVLLAVLALAASACGGSDSGVSVREPGTADESEAAGADRSAVVVAAELSEVQAQLLVSMFGDQGGLDALLLAWERGYSASQVADGIRDATLGAEGIIEAAEPQTARLGLIELSEGPPTTASLSSLGTGQIVLVAATRSAVGQALKPIPIEVAREKALSAAGGDVAVAGEILGLKVIAQLLFLSKVGYTPEQIIESIILGGAASTQDTPNELRPERNVECPLLRDATGEFIAPAEESRGPSECRHLFDRLSQSGDGSAVPPDEPSTPSDDNAEPGTVSGEAERTEPITVAGAITSGTIINGQTILEVLVNEVQFVIPPDDGPVVGTGKASRRADTGTPEIRGNACRDIKVSPIGFEFTGSFDGPERTTISGTYSWRVVAEEYVQEGTCPHPTDRPDSTWGAGTGTFSATWSERDSTMTGEFDVDGGTFAGTAFQAGSPTN